MCGIFAYCSSDSNVLDKVKAGLKRLEYRGYDSWGIGVTDGRKLMVKKNVGMVPDISWNPGRVISALGHTRWATTGEVSVINAHPHSSSNGSFILVQNGIVENYAELKNELSAAGFGFTTTTDTEVIVRLIESQIKSGLPIIQAVKSAFRRLSGRNTLVILQSDGSVIGIRNGSPLVVGRTGSGYVLASDVVSFADLTDEILVLENGQMVVVSGKNISFYDGNRKRVPVFEQTRTDLQVQSKNGYDHFMLKEIHEEPEAIRKVREIDKKSIIRLASAVRQARNVYCIGSGTAGAAASQTAYYLRVNCRIPARSLIGAEAREYVDLVGKGDIFIAPSQSGETADVLEIIEKVKRKSVLVASFVNMPGSMLTRMSDFTFMANAGPEVCVLSTKIFVSQIAWGYLLSMAVSGRYKEGIDQLTRLEKEVRDYLNNGAAITGIKKWADALSGSKDIFLLGKGQNREIIREGMVKLIEGTYIHAHAVPAGDLKHYAITLMENGVNVIGVVSNDADLPDMKNALGEVKARGARVWGIGQVNLPEFSDYHKITDQEGVSAIFNVIPLQLLSYYMAVHLGRNVDRPRNIAKSVTVK